MQNPNELARTLFIGLTSPVCVDGLTGIKEAINAAFPKEVFFQAITETGAESTVKCALCRSAVYQTNPHKKIQPTEFTE